MMVIVEFVLLKQLLD